MFTTLQTLPYLSITDMPKSSAKVHKKGLHGIRWSIAQAAVEFDVDRGVLTRGLLKQGISASEDGMFSTGQVCSALYGDIDKHRARKYDADASNAEMDNEIKRRKAVSVPSIVRFLGKTATLISSRIRASNLDDDAKRELLLDLSRFFDEHLVTKSLFGDLVDQNEDEKI